MNRKYTRLITAGCFYIVLCCISCHSNRNESTAGEGADKGTETANTELPPDAQPQALSFSTFREEKKVFVNNNPRFPFCKIDVQMEYPSNFYDSGKLKEIQRLFLANTLGEAYSDLQPAQAGALYIQKYIDDYQEEMQGYIDELKNRGEAFEPENESWMHYTLQLSTRSLFDSRSIWSYSSDIYTYTGGAHGMSGTIYQSIDTEKGLPIQLNDIFDEKDAPLLTAMLKRELMKKEKVSTEEELNENGYWPENISPTENFYVDEKGITWLYNPYEIAAYALGPIPVTLSYDKVAPYILPESPVRRLSE